MNNKAQFDLLNVIFGLIVILGGVIIVFGKINLGSLISGLGLIFELTKIVVEQGA